MGKKRRERKEKIEKRKKRKRRNLLLSGILGPTPLIKLGLIKKPCESLGDDGEIPRGERELGEINRFVGVEGFGNGGMIEPEGGLFG